MLRRKRTAAMLFASACLAAGVAGAQSENPSVNPESAAVGAYGLEVQVGCSLPQDVVLSSPPDPVEGDFEACSSITADDVEIGNAGAVFRAGEVIRLGDGFRVADGADFVAEISAVLSGFGSVADPSPIAEQVYNSTFYLRLDDLTLAEGDSIEHFTGYSGSGESQFVVNLRQNPGGQNSLHLAAREDGGGLVQMTPGQELPLAAGWNQIDIQWSSGEGTGGFLVAVNEGSFTGLEGLSNSLALIESVRWGALSGSLSTTSGKIQLDGFNSWR